MLPEKPATEPRRKWHLLRWMFVVFVVVFGWGGWSHYDFRQAVKEAEERHWEFYYNDPAVIIREDWRAAFRKETWSGSEGSLRIRSRSFSERDFDLIRRLKPKRLEIDAPFPWRDLSPLKGLSNLMALELHDCPNLSDIDALNDLKYLTELAFYRAPVHVNFDTLKELTKLTDLILHDSTTITNVDSLRELKALKFLSLSGCAGLKNVRGLHGLKGLEEVHLDGCTVLTDEAVNALKAALPKTVITTVDGY